ncbi:EAL domain-containing protein [Bacillus sp. SB49]|uniref:bifunctional diguanylate cyclase/phosphodiesterase n=1 Tax=Bacillus sp. SB49 TaxID=1071080 RepID=UPI0004226446|nr:bifunctional diguanylate cyclase/phosphodiesterase [Bacillus sp. SB49]QHT45309.1 EAL domain-containing protein [Bacillus sp. SB49]
MAQIAEHPWKTLKQLSIPVWFYQLSDEKIYLNEPLQEMLGIELAVMDKQQVKEKLHEEDWSYFERLARSERSERILEFDYRWSNGGESHWFKDIVHPFYNEVGNRIGYSGIGATDRIYQMDLGRIKNAIVEIGEGFLRYNGQAFFDFLVKYLAAVLQVNTAFIGKWKGQQKNELFVSSIFHKGETSNGDTYQVEESPLELLATSVDCFYPSRAQEYFPSASILKRYEVESFLGKTLMSSDQEPIGVLAVMDQRKQTNNPMIRPLLQIFADRIANEMSRIQTEEKLEVLSRYDSLTGLLTRNYFSDILPGALEESAILLLFDIDNFKMINDSWGHAKGDELLRQFASYLRKTFAKQECVLSRISSDEYAVLIRSSITLEDVCLLGEQIIHSMRRPFIIEGKEFYTTVSIGIATSTPDSGDAEEVLRRADAAMHKAKRNGKNRYEIYDSRMGEQMREELQLKQALHQALEEGEFLLYYQPQISGETLQVKGFEALIRWNHPEHGLLSPHHFISLAEETGMIVDIGEWVLREACRQAKQWQEYGEPHLKVAVNLSAYQFADVALTDKIMGALTASGLAPESLIIEITETMVLQDFDRSIETLNTLRNSGISIHLDDFGVGFSSLSYLHRLPVDAIKIDRSFINQIDSDRNEVVIVNAIISMAQSLGLDVIAEGVERKEHIVYLQEKGCYDYQGYFFSKPVPAECVSL